ncbi:alpha/beta hydrolase [Salicola sp. Rm-C-2C1-2]|uniref:alpha/beta fold hydrolase n=1 Tax=Salicola sp. Rm-C-2C1-2 TaxID=3141321 RepID=UPI0032E44C6E
MDILKRNHVHITGDGQTPLILAHGFGCDQQIWDGVLPYLTPRYRVVLFDYVGCGRSDTRAWSAERYHHLDGYCQDLLEVCDALALDNPLMVGHSVSGTIGMLASVARPGYFRQLIAIGPSPCYLNKGDYQGGYSEADIAGLLDMLERNRYEWAGYLAPLAMENSHRPELAERLRQSFLAGDPYLSRIFAEATFWCDVRDRMPSVTASVDLLHSSHDIIVPYSVIDYLHKVLPRNRVTPLNVAGHYPHVAEPEQVASAILTCLDQTEFHGPLAG